MGATKTTTDADVTTDVLQRDKPVLVNFRAEWCGPRERIAPVLEDNSATLSVVELNLDENPGAALDYQIMGIPTMAVCQNGKIVKQIVGAKPQASILRDLERFL